DISRSIEQTRSLSGSTDEGQRHRSGGEGGGDGGGGGSGDRDRDRGGRDVDHDTVVGDDTVGRQHVDVRAPLQRQVGVTDRHGQRAPPVGYQRRRAAHAPRRQPLLD